MDDLDEVTERALIELAFDSKLGGGELTRGAAEESQRPRQAATMNWNELGPI